METRSAMSREAAGAPESARPAAPGEAARPARADAVAAARRVLVVGGSPERPEPALLRRLAAEADLVVVCDAGADACLAADVVVDVLVGDADSASPEALAFARRTAVSEAAFPMDKDDVDLGLAVAWVRAWCPQARELVFTGVSGGRTDHALAVVGILVRAADLAPTVEENDAVLRVLAPQGRSRWAFAPEDAGRTASVLAPVGEAVVSERGMRWNLDYAPLAPLDDLGVSNVVQDEGACVEVHEGVALVCLLRDRITKESRLA